MKTLIKEITAVTNQGVGLKLTEKAALNGDMSTKTWWVSWDKIGKALFEDQYSDAKTIVELNIERGNSK